ncbi:MFS transporter [Saccharopolyspora thermophila]|uniref:MFS transporter n=1 Tax=Saccharopolyspora thermophila TaxID=89367 RepID=UPI001E479F29|nr:MFS transporter [Saccharopolyspora subtropica]
MLATGLSLVVVDGTAVGVALPAIIADLSLDISDAQWTNSLYSVVFAALLLGAGGLGDRWGRRRLFTAGVVVFALGSLLAGLAETTGGLIGARLVQGIGGAAVLPAALSTVNAVFRGRDRVIAFAIWGSVISGMAAVGPLLGGWLAGRIGWRWIFLINLPIALVVLVSARVVVPQTRASKVEAGPDAAGLLLSAVGCGAVVFAVIEGAALGWWRPVNDLTAFGLTWPRSAPVSIVVPVAALGLLALAGFVLWERRRVRTGRSVLLDPGLFTVPTFRWGTVTVLAVAVGEFGLLFALPLFLVNVLALGTLAAGMVLAAMAVGAFVAGAGARHLAARSGPAKVVVVGLALEVAGAVALAAALRPDLAPGLVALPLVIYGAGLGLASAQLTGTTLVDVPVDRSGQAAAAQSAVRQFGAALGTAIAGAVLSLGLAGTVVSALEAVHVPPPVAQQVAEATRASAGALIGRLRETDPTLAPAVVEAFGDATRYACLATAVFLVLGLVGAVRLAIVDGRRTS